MIRVTRQAVRNTQLYRTLPHEIGHWTDFLERVRRDDNTDRPVREREQSAHRYADAVRGRLTRNGDIPFHQIIDRASLLADQLDPTTSSPQTALELSEVTSRISRAGAKKLITRLTGSPAYPVSRPRWPQLRLRVKSGPASARIRCGLDISSVHRQKPARNRAPGMIAGQMRRYSTLLTRDLLHIPYGV
jgi:hypothetical protein